MKIDKKKLKELSPEEAKELLSKIARSEIEPQNIELSSASQRILWQETGNSQAEIDELLESEKDE